MMKGGQTPCACHRHPSRRHGRYFEWTYKVKGKTVNVKLSPPAAPLYQAATKQHRKLKAVLARMERLGGSHGCRERAFHIVGAAPVQLAVARGAAERLARGMHG